MPENLSFLKSPLCETESKAFFVVEVYNVESSTLNPSSKEVSEIRCTSHKAMLPVCDDTLILQSRYSVIFYDGFHNLTDHCSQTVKDILR
jgi:hypothetical protein